MKPVYKNLGKVRPTVDNNNWSIDNKYDLLTIVYDSSSNKSYISIKDVPANIVIDNREYWLPFGVGRFVFIASFKRHHKYNKTHKMIHNNTDK